MTINSHQRVRLVAQKTNTMSQNGLKTKYVVLRKGKTICLVGKGIESKFLTDEAFRDIVAGETVSILRKGMSRVQIARISRTLNDSGAKIIIVNN